MNVTFTGTTKNRAANHGLYKDVFGNTFIKNEFMCTLDDEGKPNLYELKPTLNEFHPYGKRTGNDTIVISVKSNLSKSEFEEARRNFDTFIAKYNPKADEIKINDNVVIQDKNRNYIFKKLLELTEDVKSTKLPTKNKEINLKLIAVNLLGINSNNKSELADYIRPEKIKLNIDLISKALKNVIKRTQ